MKLQLYLSLRRALYACYAVATLALASTMNLAHAETYEFIGEGSGNTRDGQWGNVYHWSPYLHLSQLGRGPASGSSVHFGYSGTITGVSTQNISTISTGSGNSLLTLHCSDAFSLFSIGNIENATDTLRINYAGVGGRIIGTINNSGSSVRLYGADTVTVTNGVYSPYVQNGWAPLGGIDVGASTLNLTGKQQDQTIGQLNAGKLYVDNGKVSLQSYINPDIKLETTNDGAIALQGTDTISGEIINNGALTTTSLTLTLSGKVSGSGSITTSSHLYLTNSDQNQSMGTISAASISITNGSISVGSISRNDTDINFSGLNGILKINQHETLGSISGIGAVFSNGYNLTLTDSNWASSGPSVSLGSGTLTVGGTSGRIYALRAGKFKITSGTALISNVLTSTMDLDIANGARVTFDKDVWIDDLLNTGTVASKGKNLTITGSVANADVDLGSGTLSLNNNRTRSIDSLSAGRLNLNAGTLTVNSITSYETHLSVASGTTITLKNAETIGSIYNTGTVATENKNLTVNGEITSTNINLGTGLLTVNNVVNNRVINNLTAGGLTLNAGTLAVNSITSDTTDLTIASGAALTLNDTETIKNLAGTGTVITEDLDLIVTGAVGGTSIDLGTGMLTVSQTGNMGSLTAGMLDINAGTFTVNNLTTETTDVDVAGGAKLILNNAATIKNLVGTGTIQTQGKNLTVNGTINGADINLGTGALTVSQTGNVGDLTAGLLTLNAGTLTVNSITDSATNLDIAGGAKVILHAEETIHNLSGTGTVETQNLDLTVAGTIAGANIALGTGTLTVSQAGNVGALTAGLLNLNAGTLTVNSITDSATNLNIAGGAKVMLNNAETINNLSGTGTVETNNKVLNIGGTIGGTNIDLGTSVLLVRNDIANREIGSLTAGGLTIYAGTLTVNSITGDATNLDIEDGAKLILNNAARINNLSHTGTVETQNFDLTVAGRIEGANIALGAATLTSSQGGYMGTLTAGLLNLNAGTLTVDSITGDTISLDIAGGAKVVLNDAETIHNLSGTGTLKTNEKSLMITGEIHDTNIDLDYRTLSVLNNVADRVIDNLTAGGLELNTGELTVNSLNGDTIDIRVTNKAILTLNQEETVDIISGSGTVKTENKNLTASKILLDTNIDLGTGTLTVESAATQHKIGDLTVGGLTLAESVSVSLNSQGNIGHLTGSAAAALYVNGSYTLSSAKDIRIDVQANATLSIGASASSGDSSPNNGLTNVTLNISADGKVHSSASLLGIGNTINNSGTLVLKGGSLNSDINNPVPFSGVGSSSQIIIDGKVISNNTINTTLTKFAITDSSTYDQLFFGLTGTLNTADVRIDILNYTLTEGDTFYFVTSWTDWGSSMDGVQLSFEGQDLLAEGYDYTIINTGTQWGVSFQLIPEPSTATLSLLALAGLLARRRRKAA